MTTVHDIDFIDLAPTVSYNEILSQPNAGKDFQEAVQPKVVANHLLRYRMKYEDMTEEAVRSYLYNEVDKEWEREAIERNIGRRLNEDEHLYFEQFFNETVIRLM